MKAPETIAVDFDGVINSYRSGHTKGGIFDPPVPGAIEWLEGLIQSPYKVVIYSGRLTDPNEKAVMQDWLLRNGLSAGALAKLAFEAKPIAVMYVDDRAWKFNGNNFPSLGDIANFRPWYEKAQMASSQYSYDHRKIGTASPDSILNLIIKAVLSGRKIQNLLTAYKDAVIEDHEEEYGAFTDDPPSPEAKRWYRQVLDFVSEPHEIETALKEAYVKGYLKIRKNVDKREVSETFTWRDWPYDFPTKGFVPLRVIEAVGNALGVQSALAVRTARIEQGVLRP